MSVCCAKPISTKCFPFYSYVNCLKKVVRNQLFTYSSCWVEICWVDSCYQVDENNIPFGGRSIAEMRGGGGGEDGAWTKITTMLYLSRKQLSQLSINLVGRVTAHEVFCTFLAWAATAHSHNTLSLYLGKILGQLSPNFEY